MVNFQNGKKTCFLSSSAFILTRPNRSGRAAGEHYHLDLSSATIRNEMSALTEWVPTPAAHFSRTRTHREGYRYFRQPDDNQAELPRRSGKPFRIIPSSQPDVEQWMHWPPQLRASITGRLCHLSPAGGEGPIRHVELIGRQGRQILMSW